MRTAYRRLFVHGDTSSRSTRHIELDLPSDVSYETGDHLSVKPVNALSLVVRLCSCFGHELEIAAARSGYYRSKKESNITISTVEDGINQSLLWQIQQTFYIECNENEHTSLHHAHHLTNNTLVEVLRTHVDLSLNQESYLVDLLSMIMMKLDKALVTTKHANSFKSIVQPAIEEYNVLGTGAKLRNVIGRYPTVVHFFEEFGSLLCHPLESKVSPLITLADLLVLMPRLNSRYYSISSSEKKSPYKVSITVGVVNAKTEGGMPIQGVCSHHLAQLKPGDWVQAAVVGSSFRAPLLKYNPIIMICAGTGLAPLMGFLGDRASMMSKNSRGFGECHLFFGCRSDEEILYKDYLAELESNGVMSLHRTK